MKRVCKLCVVFIIISGILLTCLITSYAYSNVYPEYLKYADCAYIEINSNLGVGCIVVPINYQFDNLTIYNNSIANIGSGTITGYFIGSNGTTRQIRIQSLSTVQYYYTQGYQTYYEDLTFTSILNTNVNLNSVSSQSQDKVYNFTTPQIVIVVLLCFILFVDFLKLVYFRVK